MTKVIHLHDNDYIGKEITDIQEVIEDIRDIASYNLQKFPDSLLFYPQSFSEVKDGIVKKDGEERLPILNVVDVIDNKATNPSEASLKTVKMFTNNVMGFVGKGNTSVSIHSRFTRSDNDGEDYFLYYMLQRVFNINMFKLDHSLDRQDKIMDFLLFMFPNALKNALSQGLYKEYRSQEFDDARVRGTILVNKVIRNDIPFRGRISYRTRVHSYDNTITQLVRHTIEHIKRHPFGAAILNNDSETKEYVDKIIMATPTYNPRDKEKVLKANLRPKIHPYFLKYKNLQDLCVRILRHESLKYGEDKDKVHGILFDGAWLWEEYLNTILKDIHFKHPRNKTGEGAVQMFEKVKNSKKADILNHQVTIDYKYQPMFPDFYKIFSTESSSKHAGIILDAKYKRIDGDPEPKDLYQVISYMYCMKIDLGGYLYPTLKEQTIKRYKLTGRRGFLMTMPFQIPDNTKNWTEFQRDIKNSEEELRTNLTENQ